MKREATMISKVSLGLRVSLGLLFALSLALPAVAVPWPYQPFNQTHGLGNHFGEYQNYGGSPYYHDGIDLVTPSGPTNTYSVSTDTVTHITVNEPLYSGIMIGTPVSGGLGWLYWHITASTMPFDVGDSVNMYDYIGTTASWPVASFYHTHFNRVMGTGGYPWNWYEAIDNPLLYLVPNTDPDRPVFETTYQGKKFAYRRNAAATVLDPTALSGDVDVVSRIKDIVGMPQWGLNPWKIDYWIRGATNSVPVTNSVTFSGHIPPDATVGVIYSTQSPLNTQGNYDSRIYYFIVTNTDGDGFVESTDANYCWRTGDFGPGDYWTYVRAADIGGNVVTDSMMCTVAGTVSPDVNLPETSHDFGGVLPLQTATWDLRVQNLGIDWLSIREITSSSSVFTVNRSHFYVGPAGEELVRVSFTPLMPQVYLGTLQIKTNDPDEPLLNVTLQGRGLNPATAEDAAPLPSFGLRGVRVVPASGLEVRYALDRRGTAALDVYDVAGHRVRGIELSGADAGVYTWLWNGTDGSGRRMPSGVYFVRLRCGVQSASGSAVLVR